MNISIPKKESIGQGRLVRCDNCQNLNHLGSMITAEHSSAGQMITKQLCSIGCLADHLKEVSYENSN